MNGSTYSTAVSLGTVSGADWKIAATDDFNGDGQADILWRNTSTGNNDSGRTVLWLMNGVALSSSPDIGTVSAAWSVVGTGDFNGDGQSDIFWRNSSNGQNVIWLMNGTAFSTAISLPTLSGTGWAIAGITDFNGDQKNDILWRNYSSGQTAIWLMNGTTYSAAVDFGTTNTNWKIISSTTQFDSPSQIDNAGNTTTTAFNIGSLNGSGSYSGVVGTNDNNDYYRFDLAVTTGVRFRLSGLSGDANLQLLDSSSVLQSSSNPDSTAEMVTAHLSAGTYYVRVYASGADVNTSYGLSVVIDTIAPVVTAHLENDTVLVYNTAPVAGADWITSIATIIGSVSETHLISSFQAGFENKTIANYVNVLPQMQADGSFSLSRSLLDTIYGGSLPEGVHTLTLLAQDEFGNLSTPFSLTFTLDTIAPTVPTIALIPESDSGSSHQDRVTKVNNPMIRGVAEAGSLVIIYRDYGTDNAGRAAVYANSNGIWQAGYADLTDGVHTFKVEAGDVAGNISAVSDTLSVTIDTVAPTLTISSLSNNATLMNNARLVGSANGTGSVIDSVSYYFDTLATGQSPISVTVQADGGFDVAIDFTGISNGAHTLTVKAIDLAGNEITLPPYSITVNRDLDAPIILAELVNDTSLYGYTNTDGITSDPTVSGTVTNVDQVTVLRAGFGNIQTANFIDITAQLQADGSFTLNQAQLEAIYGGTLSQGAHTLHLQAEDEQGNLSELFDLTFNLDTQAPIAPVNLSWTAVGTTAVKISGSAEAGALVELYEGTDLIAETYADATGNWRVTTSQLRNGTHSLSATATDLAGNTSPASTATSLSINTLVPAMPKECG
ncbi:Ig-like domain-containing protein (plasmid) [Kovacikia minuta CCNUW1]|uniref:Ig-like domain-containing protein n=1 Tax=Kovacikia minuta TaxID=2931930 RepID=UPI001CCBD6D4|nr:Ig-like domain-containing protein [Kovacikia minuta]UBF30067.1 Ig-like domain-containing protein [Kovacikia minuta CCNUW1]